MPQLDDELAPDAPPALPGHVGHQRLCKVDRIGGATQVGPQVNPLHHLPLLEGRAALERADILDEASRVRGVRLRNALEHTAVGWEPRGEAGRAAARRGAPPTSSSASS